MRYQQSDLPRFWPKISLKLYNLDDASAKFIAIFQFQNKLFKTITV